MPKKPPRAPQLFDHYFVASCGADGTLAIPSSASFGPDPEPLPAQVEHFCFPLSGGGGGSGAGGTEGDREFQFALTDGDGGRQYGFCLRTDAAAGGGRQVLCLLSGFPWTAMFGSLLELAEARRAADGDAAALCAVFDRTQRTFPLPGERFKVRLSEDGAESLLLKRPDDEAAPSAELNHAELFRCLGISGVMAVFTAMLAEQRCLFVSSNISRLSSAVRAASGLVYPFAWQHIFVPILPQCFLPYISAPMPFVCGLHSSLLAEAMSMPTDDLALVNLDKCEVSYVAEAAAVLPAGPGRELERTLVTIWASLERKAVSDKEFGAGVADAFLRFMVRVLGHYRNHFTSGAPAFKFDAGGFTDANGGKHAEFFSQVDQTQMFNIWCLERTQLAKENFPRRGLFESGVELGAGKMESEFGAAVGDTVNNVTASFKGMLGRARHKTKEAAGGLSLGGSRGGAPRKLSAGTMHRPRGAPEQPGKQQQRTPPQRDVANSVQSVAAPAAVSSDPFGDSPFADIFGAAAPAAASPFAEYFEGAAAASSPFADNFAGGGGVGGAADTAAPASAQLGAGAEVDLLGLGGAWEPAPAPAAVSTPPPAAAVGSGDLTDLMGFNNTSRSTPSPACGNDLLDLFG